MRAASGLPGVEIQRLLAMSSAILCGERLEGHRTEVLIAPGAHCDGTCCLLLVADDEDVRQLLQRMLPYFIRNLLVAQIQLDPKPLILQRFGNFAGVIGLGVA